MEESLTQHSWLKKIRWLSHALIISGGLNLGFLTTFAVMVYRNVNHKKVDRVAPQEESFSRKIAYASSDSSGILSEYFETPYQELLLELSNKELVEDGYARRDYALACLVAFHYFDIHKALTGVSLQTRLIEFIHTEGGERVRLEVFAALEDVHFDAIVKFAKLEKWPFTAQGLYVLIQRIKNIEALPASLKDAFYLTPQFHAVWIFLSRIEKTISVDEVLCIARDLDWDYLEKFYQEICRKQDFSEEKRREFLIAAIDRQSKSAAGVFLKCDREFALSKLDDKRTIFILNQLDRHVPNAEQYARQLLMSVRSDAVHKAAAEKLYRFAGEEPPKIYDHEKAVLRFLPSLFHQEKLLISNSSEDAPAPPLMLKKYHLVAKGDTLWKIAITYHVPLKELMKANHLDNRSLIKPGMKLEIP